MRWQFLIGLLSLFSLLFAEPVETFYGTFEVEEPVLLELIKSPAMQRLKEIHQYGVAYYTTHKEEYNRYDHSLGVFAILRKNGASLQEQIAALLHDVSHTVFSHVSDWVFNKEYHEDDYQSTIYKLYVCHSGVEKILLKHGFTINQVYSKNGDFKMLEQHLPNLCADRLDYNIQGAYFQNFLTKEEALKLFNSMHFEEGNWVSEEVGLLKKIGQFSLHMTVNCWGGAANYVTSRWLADAIIEGLDTGLLSWCELHFGIDRDVWEKLQDSTNPVIKNKMYKITHAYDFFHLGDEDADLIVKYRFRGINPWTRCQGTRLRLTDIDFEFAQQFDIIKKHSEIGWRIKLKK